MDWMEKHHLNYIDPILAAGRLQDINALATTQRKCIRVAAGANFFAHAPTIFRDFEIIPVAQLITYQIALFMFDFLAGNLPESFTEEWLLTDIELLLNMGECLETTTTFTFPY